ASSIRAAGYRFGRPGINHPGDDLDWRRGPAGWKIRLHEGPSPRASVRSSLRFALVFFASALLTVYAIDVHLSFEQRNQAARVVRAGGRAGIDADRRTVGEVVNDVRREGVDAEPFFRLIGLARDIMPLGNTPDRTIVFCNEVGRYMVFRADRHGFNNPD